jgi:uncharacterized protein
VKYLIAFLGLLLWPAAAFAADFTIPPAPDHHVTDNAGVLSDSTQAWLENDLTAYEQSTGHQIVVWIGQSTGGVPLEEWTNDTAERWKIGRKGHDDGAVLFVFMRDHKVRIEVGYGLESALTDADSHRIITETILPKMKSGDTEGAIVDGAVAMLQTVTPSFQSVAAPAPTPAQQSMRQILYPLLWFVGFLILLRIIRRMFGPLGAGYFIGSSLGGRGFGGGGFGGGFGGGGFSGGGGGFGGGGASGGW